MELIVNKNINTFDKYKIKAIIFDSGRVLNRPVTGHWFIPPNFFSYVDKKKFKAITSSQKKNAFKKAGEYINMQKLILTEDEEYEHFIEYYKIFSKYLPELQLDNRNIISITKDLVYNYSKYKFYKDAVKLIPELSKVYKLAVVSDAWPSLENVFKEVGLKPFFSSFVISSKKGVTKPNELMYKTALAELDVSPEETIFIDDNIKNCDGARNLGINTFVLCRDLRLYFYRKFTCRKYKIINTLTYVSKTLGAFSSF